MEKITIVGMKLSEFTGDNGKKVPYARLFVTIQDDTKEDIDGVAVDIVKIKPDMIHELQVGDIIDIAYTKFGGVREIKVL